MSKLNVGVGEDFPVDSADPKPSDDDRDEGCPYPGYHGRGRRFRRYGYRRGPFLFLGPLALIVFIAMVSLAVNYPWVILALIVVAALAFAGRHRRHWHDWHDDDGRDERRGDWRERDRRDYGPQPDAPDAPSSGRS